MSDDTADAEVEVEEIEQKGQKHEASRDLDRVTNNFEEKEVDASKIGNAISLVNEASKKNSLLKKGDAHAAVKINEGDVELIIKELELSRQVAEKSLRENGGDLKLTLKKLVNS